MDEMDGGSIDEVIGGSDVTENFVEMNGGAKKITSSSDSKGISHFFNYLFRFDDATKCELLNILQYGLLSIIPVMFVLRAIKKYFPEATPFKGTLEIAFESFLEISLIFISIYLIHRMVEYIPTYSATPYGHMNFIHAIPYFLVLLLTMQTKLGAKVNILMDRLFKVVEGMTSKQEEEEEEEEDPMGSFGKQVSSSKPVSGVMMPQMPSAPPSFIPTGGTGLGGGSKSTKDSFVQGGGMNNGMSGGFEPMAANGGGFGSPF